MNEYAAMKEVKTRTRGRDRDKDEGREWMRNEERTRQTKQDHQPRHEYPPWPDSRVL